MAEQMSQPFDLLLGRKTYELIASYWPHHEAPGIDRAIKYVASRSVMRFTWENSVLLQGDAVTAVRALKAQNGPDLQVHGSSSLIQTLLSHDLVDQLWLKTFPIVLGGGKRCLRKARRQQRSDCLT
jgi:dihydrofolate reductase